MNRPLLSDPPLDALLADLQSQLDYARLAVKIAEQSADRAEAELAAMCRMVPSVAPEPDPPIWHAIRQAPTQRIGLPVGFVW